MRNAGVEETQAGMKIAGRNINNLRYADDTTLMAESEEELKSLLMKVKRSEWKSWLQAQHSENEHHGIWSHHFMANRWGNSGNSIRLYFGGLQNPADGDCSHEIKRCLLLGREKAMAPHSSTVARKIPWMEEPGRLQSMGSLRVRQDWATSLSLSTFMHWRRKWQPTPVFLPGESHGRRSLVGSSPWGRTELDTTEAT